MPEQREFQVAAHVDSVIGYRATLSITREHVTITYGWFRTRSGGCTVVHEGDCVTLAHIRWQVPWRRAALVLYDDEHQVVVPLTERAAARIAHALRASGHVVREESLGSFDGPESLAAMQQYRYRIRRRGR